MNKNDKVSANIFKENIQTKRKEKEIFLRHALRKIKENENNKANKEV